VPLNQSHTLHNHIHVSVRLKPLAEHEQSMHREKRQLGGPWQIVNETTIRERTAKESFHFDRVFGPAVTTEQIFREDLRNMMCNALKGYNVSVLAYGQTNSGKTFTITGGLSNDGEEQPGII